MKTITAEFKSLCPPDSQGSVSCHPTRRMHEREHTVMGSDLPSQLPSPMCHKGSPIPSHSPCVSFLPSEARPPPATAEITSCDVGPSWQKRRESLSASRKDSTRVSQCSSGKCPKEVSSPGTCGVPPCGSHARSVPGPKTVIEVLDTPRTVHTDVGGPWPRCGNQLLGLASLNYLYKNLIWSGKTVLL